MENQLEGKVAIVTGAGRGLGRCEAIEMARQGARVVVCDLGVGADGSGTSQDPAQEVVEEIKGFGGEAIASYGDVTNWSDCEKTLQTAVDTFGDLNILGNGLLASAVQGQGGADLRPAYQYFLGGFFVRINRPAQLCCSQGRHHGPDHVCGPGHDALWRDSQCNMSASTNCHDHGQRDDRCHVRQTRGGF